MEKQKKLNKRTMSLVFLALFLGLISLNVRAINNSYKVATKAVSPENAFISLKADSHDSIWTNNDTVSSGISDTLVTGQTDTTAPCNILIYDNLFAWGNKRTIQINAAYGIEPYTYEWDGIISSKDLINPSVGNHTLIVRDASGCSVSENFYIKDNSLDSIASSQCQSHIYYEQTSSNVFNFGATTAYGDTIRDNGFCFWAFDKANVDTVTYSNPHNIAFRTTGMHLVELYTISNSGCKNYDSIYIYISNIDSISNTCNLVINGNVLQDSTQSNGAIITDVKNGVEPYTYEWDGKIGYKYLTSASYGYHNLVVRDAMGCIASAQYYIKNNTIDTITTNTCLTKIGYNQTSKNTFDFFNAIVYATFNYDSVYYQDLRWVFDNSADTLAVQNPSNITFNTLGNHSVELFMRGNNGCYGYDQIFVYVMPNDSSITNDTILIPERCNLDINGYVNTSDPISGTSIITNITGGINPYIFEWDGVSGTQNLFYPAPGYHYFTVRDGAGCVARKEFYVKNHNNDSTGSTFTCSANIVYQAKSNNTYDFYADPTMKTIMYDSLSGFNNYKWYFEGASIDSAYNQNPSDVIFNTSGNHKVRLITSNIYTNCISSTEVYIYVPYNDSSNQGVDSTYTNIVDSLTTTPVDTCISFSIDSLYISKIKYKDNNTVEVIWMFKGKKQSMEIPAVYTFNKKGKTKIYLSLNCSERSLNSFMQIINIGETTGVNSTEAMDITNINTYPNPVNDILNIDFASNTSQSVIISINSIDGQLMMTQTEHIKKGKNHVTLNTSNLGHGSYIVSANVNNKSFYQKFIK